MPLDIPDKMSAEQYRKYRETGIIQGRKFTAIPAYKEMVDAEIAGINIKVPGARQIIFGNVPSKSNSYRVSGKRLVKTQIMKDWEQSFESQCREKGRLVGEFDFYMKVIYSSNRPDLDGSLKGVLDCLQKCQVIKNDRKCKLLVIEWGIDRVNPRIEYIVKEH